MAIDPLAPNPLQTPVPQEPGFFDGTAALTQPASIQPVMQNPLAPPPAPENHIEVAGVGGLVKGMFKGFDAKHGLGPSTEKVEKALGDGKSGGVGNEIIVIREATEKDIEEYNAIVGKTSGVPSPTPGQKAAGIPVADVNLERIEGPDDLKKTIDKMAQLHPKGPPVTAADVKKMADAHGLRDVVEKLLKRKEGDAINLDLGEIHKSLQAITSSALQLNRLAEKAVDLNAGDMDLLAFHQHFAFHSALQSSMQGLQADVARALGVFKIPRGPNEIQSRNVANMLGDLTAGAGNPLHNSKDRTQAMARAYLALPTQAAKNKFAKKGAIARYADAWYEMWINGLLSGVQTQVINIAGNGAFAAIQPFERALGGAFGSVWRAGFGRAGGEKGVYATEAVDMVTSWVSATIDAARLAGQAFWRDQPMFDALGKFENAHQQAISARNLNLEQYGELIKGVIDYIGKGIRIPGRLLMTTDEFFKAFNYRIELAAEANRKRRMMGEQVDEAGQPIYSQEDIDEAVNGVFADPPEDVHGRAEEMARINTFTNSVPNGPFSGARSAIMRTPGGRYVMPFFRVIHNIAGQAVERSPLGIMHVVKAIHSKDPVARDMALAKLSWGSAAMAATASWAGEGRITGTGPMDYKVRNEMEKLGWKPYSIVVDKVDKPRWMYVGQHKFKHPKDVEYYSYHRMEPISMILAIGADTGQRMAYPDTTAENHDEIAVQAVAASWQYMKDQSFLAGFAMVADAISQDGPAVNRLVRNFASSQMPYSSLLGSMSNVMKGDKPLKETGVNPREPAGFRHLYSGLRRLDQRTPFSLEFLGSDLEDMPVSRDMFYEPVYSKKPRVVDNALPPFLITAVGLDPEKTMEDPVRLEIVRLVLPFGDEPPRSVEGVLLTPVERDAINSLINFPPGQESMYEEFSRIFKEDSYKALPPKDQRAEVQTIYEARRDQAVELMRDDPKFAELFQKIKDRKTILENVGKQIQ